MPDPVVQLGELLRDVNRGIFQVTKDVARPHGVPAPGMRVFGHVVSHPGTTVSELARNKGFAKSHISRAVDGMVRAGLIEKRSDPSDQRLTRLYPTEAACEQFEGIKAAWDSKMTEALSVLSQEQMSDVIEGLKILRTALRQATSKSS